MRGVGKYSSYLSQFSLPSFVRSWPDKEITTAPIWCSVDLRDGNQALINPMDHGKRIKMWELLLDIGFREIEVGFPSASKIDYDFVRHLIERKLIPSNVAIQVLTQAREHLIDATFKSLHGAKNAILHLYNPTSKTQRRVVFQKDKAEIISIMLQGVRRIKKLSAETDTQITLEYSPESFTGTELDFALEICKAVEEIWEPTPENKVVINLPSTVEMSTPNIYADMIEWMCKNLGNVENRILSIHTHNDRAGAVVSAEFAQMAGGQRVEGTLFGNGERTGNVDIVTLALNLYTHGIDPGLDFSNLPKIKEIFEDCTGMEVHDRHPYAGDLVLTAFSGSHQDAISKGLRARGELIAAGLKNGVSEENIPWDIPYLPIDPVDIGRNFEPVIRVNALSGKGGVAFVLAQDFGYNMPKRMHPEFTQTVQALADETAKEVSPQQIWELFEKLYLYVAKPIRLVKFKSTECEFSSPDDEKVIYTIAIKGVLTVLINGREYVLEGIGNGPIDAAKHALETLGLRFQIDDYHSHTLGHSSNAMGASYVGIMTESFDLVYGVGISTNTDRANILALICAVNRAFPKFNGHSQLK